MQVLWSLLDQVHVCLQLCLSSEAEWKKKFSGPTYHLSCGRTVCFAIVLVRLRYGFVVDIDQAYYRT